MVRIHPDPPPVGHDRRSIGGVAQLGEHLLCKQGVIGSIPFTSTTPRGACCIGLSPHGCNRKPLAIVIDARRLSIRSNAIGCSAAL